MITSERRRKGIEGKERIRPTYSNKRATRTRNQIAGVKEAVGGNNRSIQIPLRPITSYVGLLV